MKYYVRFLSIAAVALLTFACSNNQEPESDNTQTEQAEKQEAKHTERPDYDFRRARWGMSRDEVKASERSKLIFEEENFVEYTMFIGDYQAQVNYKFQDDKLVRVGLYFPKEYEDKNEYITVYEFLKDFMIQSKGTPVIDKVVQINPSEKIDPEQMGQAACDGKVLHGAQWDYPGSDIQLLLRGEEGTCYLTVIYLDNIPEGAEEENNTDEVKAQEQKVGEDKTGTN